MKSNLSSPDRGAQDRYPALREGSSMLKIQPILMAALVGQSLSRGFDDLAILFGEAVGQVIEQG